jgi:phenylalanyl-tRNA synthetase alpha chain
MGKDKRGSYHFYVSLRQSKMRKIPQNIMDMTSRKLLLNENHPLGILKRLIFNHFERSYDNKYQFYDSFEPKVTVYQNFDSLGFPDDHVAK